MPTGLWLLIFLRARAQPRRILRAFTKPSTAITTIVTFIAMAAWISLYAFRQNIRHVDHGLVVARGTLLLAGACIAMLFFASRDAALALLPPEVDMVVPGPFSRRQVLVFKVFSGLSASLFGAVIPTILSRDYWQNPLAAYVGAFLAFNFVRFVLVAFSMAQLRVGALRAAFFWAVAALLAAGVAAFAFAVAHSNRDLLQMLGELLNSSALAAALTPLRVFVETFAAPSLSLDFAVHAAASAGMLALLIGVIILIDANYIEAAAASGQRRYDALQRWRKSGQAGRGSANAFSRLNISNFPHLAGAGPIAWRQAVSLIRSLRRLLFTGILILFMLFVFIINLRRSSNLADIVDHITFEPIALTFLLSQTFAFDFRADLDRLDWLKSLPVSAFATALGQVLVPVVILSSLEFALLATAYAAMKHFSLNLLALPLIALPANVVFLAVDNLLFLWFPSRAVRAGPGDFQVSGRQTLLLVARLFLSSLAFVGPAALAFFAYTLFHSPIAAGAVALASLLAVDFALLTLLAAAFRRFDVAREIAE